MKLPRRNGYRLISWDRSVDAVTLEPSTGGFKQYRAGDRHETIVIQTRGAVYTIEATNAVVMRTLR